ncbi:MAG: hypothetical protein OSB41_09720 [Kiritimatiellae bacterium]|nr:hypothetical protein [Kiritimatiellia bacterium]
MTRELCRISAAVALLLFSEQALAVSECSGHVTQIYAGDNGAVYFFLDVGASGVLAPGDPNQKNAEALGVTALAANKTAAIRFTADGVDCSAATIRNDMQGLWLRP